MLFTGLGRSVLGETVSAFFSTQTEGTVSSNTDRPRPVNNIFIFFLRRFKSLRKILIISLQPMCVEEGHVRVDIRDFKIQRRHGNENVA